MLRVVLIICQMLGKFCELSNVILKLHKADNTSLTILKIQKLIPKEIK